MGSHGRHYEPDYERLARNALLSMLVDLRVIDEGIYWGASW